MAEEIRDLLRRAVDWYEPRVSDPLDAARRTRARVRRDKAAVVVVAFVLVAGSFGFVFATFAQRQVLGDHPPASASSSEYVNRIQQQLAHLQAKLANVHAELGSAAEQVNTLADGYGEAMHKLLTTSNPSGELHRRVLRLRSQLDAQKARLNEVIAQEKLLVHEVNALLARLPARS
jgi:septal ring factor EnvC (AmiA/AmiB activator)